MKIKKLGVWLFLAVFCFPCLFVNADEDSCTTYRNYYFFNEINSLDTVKNGAEANGDGVWLRYHTTYFPNVHKVTEADGAVDRKVCIGSEIGCDDTWTLDKLYSEYKKLMTNGIDSDITIDGKPASYKSYTFTDENGVEVSYFLHSLWYETDSNGNKLDQNATVGTGSVDYSAVETSDLVSASIIPTESIADLFFTGDASDYVKATIRRTITSSNYENVTPFSLDWDSNGTVTADTVLVPALHKSEYKLCGKEVKYNATINYYKKGTTEKVADSWVKSDLNDGYKEIVESPIIQKKDEICEPDIANVDVLIDGEDFNEDVYYSCTANGKTGSAFIWGILFVAASSLGLGIWLYRKNKA